MSPPEQLCRPSQVETEVSGMIYYISNFCTQKAEK